MEVAVFDLPHIASWQWSILKEVCQQCLYDG
jgi:hypothetical protein